MMSARLIISHVGTVQNVPALTEIEVLIAILIENTVAASIDIIRPTRAVDRFQQCGARQFVALFPIW